MLDSHSSQSNKNCTFYVQKEKYFCKNLSEPGQIFCNNHVNVGENNQMPSENSSVVKRTALRDDRCHFYFEKKRRYCRVIPKEDSKYCFEHVNLVQEIVEDCRRIPCPLDNRHTCLKHLLEQHLLKCNAREELRPIYYEHDINAGELKENEDIPKIDWSSVDFDVIMRLIGTIKSIQEEYISIKQFQQTNHPSLIEELEDSNNGESALKHLKQLASLLSVMDQHNLFDNQACYVEFGAGKGGLSHWIKKGLKDSPDAAFYLIERGGVRYQKDVYHRDNSQACFERLRIDIQHLDLGKAMNSFDERRQLIGVGKHVCGAATDLSLRCLSQMMNEKIHVKRNIEGIVLALCCYHRCNWKDYVGKDFIRSLGLTCLDFGYLVKMSSWATCDPEKKITVDHAKIDGADVVNNFENYHHFRYGSLTPRERDEIGCMCKNIIDEGRVQYLKHLGFDTKIIYYVDKSVTLENRCLVANISS